MIYPAIFLDRDGVINYERSNYVKSLAEFEFLPGSLQALKILSSLARPIIIITNQAGIGRGVIQESTLVAIHTSMMEEITKAGGCIDAIYFCPHRPDDHCACRKPMPGLLLRAAEEMKIDLSNSYMVGDSEKDLLAAAAAGCHPIFVQTGLTQFPPTELTFHFDVYQNLYQAATWLAQQLGSPASIPPA
jgi:D-glycero-D-manno-heptose 1,7-bisphosphate phosphatase